MAEKLRVHVRWMIKRDMPEVMDIEAASFEFPWSEDDYIRCLRQRNCIGMVAEHNDKVIGVMIYELHPTRLHVLNFVVAEEYRRRSVGQQMMNRIISRLTMDRRTRVLLEVRESNVPAQFFFKSQKFRAVSVLRDFYFDTAEDAYLMQYRYQGERQTVNAPTNRISEFLGAD